MKGNREADLITKNAFFLEAQETNKIHECYRVICEFSEKKSEDELRKTPEIEIGTEWGMLGMVRRCIVLLKLAKWLLYDIRPKWKVRTYEERKSRKF